MDLRPSPPSPNDLELLELAIETEMDERRRLLRTCGIKIAATSDGQALYVGSDIPEELIGTLMEAVRSSPSAAAPDMEPPMLAVCRRILGASCGPLSLDAGPYFLIQPEARIAARAQIARSDAREDERLRELNPGNWGGDEWDLLLAGALGPWAMATVDGKVVSICHTPRPMTARAAECGVWTHPDYRRRGYAAEVTATWADILRPSGRYLFYSTDAENLASRGVAARLGLRPIGWTWSIAGAKPVAAHEMHPLNRRT